MAIRVEETLRGFSSRIAEVIRRTIRDLTTYNPASVSVYLRRVPFLGLVLSANVDMGGVITVIPARINIELTKRLSKELGIPVLGYVADINRTVRIDVWFPTLTYRRGASWGFRRAISELIEEVVGEKLRWQEVSALIGEVEKITRRYKDVAERVTSIARIAERLRSIAYR